MQPLYQEQGSLAQPSKTASEAYSLGETYRLGSLLDIQPVDYRRSDFYYFIWSVLMLPVSLYIVIITIYAMLNNNHTYMWTIGVILLINMINMVFVFSRHDLAFITPFNRHLRVYVYDRGIIRIKRSKPEVVCLDQIASVEYRRARQPQRSFIKIKLIDGKTMRLNNVFPGFNKLGTWLEQQHFLCNYIGRV